MHNHKTLKPSIFDFDPNQLTDTLSEWKVPSYRVKQIWQGLYRQYWSTSEQFTNLPEAFKQKLHLTFDFSSIEPSAHLISDDKKTTKTLFQLRDGFFIESILMKYRNRNSVCISSQAGCMLNCSFCATGQSGFGRDLTSGEIVEQVVWHARSLDKEGEKLTNIVLMGMGEPFLNYDNVLSAIYRLNHSEGFAFGKRRFTISTVGIIPEIKRFARDENQVNLAISLHAANNELRSSIIPVNRKYPLENLIDVCRLYIEKTNRRITFEWALIDGVNDRPSDAEELISLVKGMLCHVNLIPLNPTENFSKKASSDASAQQFKTLLEKAHIPCSIRLRRGIDIQAGCGQLAGQAKLPIKTRVK